MDPRILTDDEMDAVVGAQTTVTVCRVDNAWQERIFDYFNFCSTGAQTAQI